MRKLAAVLMAMMFLSGCSLPKAENEAPVVVDTKGMQAVTVEFAHELGEDAVAYFLGREFNPTYADLFAGLGTIVRDDVPIYLSDEAAQVLNQKLYEAVLLSMTLPGSPDYVPPKEDRRLEASGGYHIEANPEATQAISEFQRQLFPDGTAPDINALDSTGKITDVFKTWFMRKADELGWVDKRLKLDADNKPYVLAGEYEEGSTYNILGTAYSPVVPVELVTSKTVATSKTYKLVRMSYKFFDNGTYQAIYTTDPKAGATRTVSIEVTILGKGVLPDTKEGFIGNVDKVRVRLL